MRGSLSDKGDRGQKQQPVPGRIYLPSYERVKGVLPSVILIICRGTYAPHRAGTDDLNAELVLKPLGVDIEVLSSLNRLIEELSGVLLFLELKAEAVGDETQLGQSGENDGIHSDLYGSQVGLYDLVIEVGGRFLLGVGAEARILPEDCPIDKQGDFVGANADEVIVSLTVGSVGGDKLHLVVDIDDPIGPRAIVRKHFEILVAEIGVLGVGLDDTRRHTAYLAELGPARLSEALEKDVRDGLVEEAEPLSAKLEDKRTVFVKLAVRDAVGVGSVDEDDSARRDNVTSVDEEDIERVRIIGVRIQLDDGVTIELRIEDGLYDTASGGQILQGGCRIVVRVTVAAEQSELRAKDFGLAQEYLRGEVSIVHDVVEEFLEAVEARVI